MVGFALFMNPESSELFGPLQSEIVNITILFIGQKHQCETV